VTSFVRVSEACDDRFAGFNQPTKRGAPKDHGLLQLLCERTPTIALMGGWSPSPRPSCFSALLPAVSSHGVDLYKRLITILEHNSTVMEHDGLVEYYRTKYMIAAYLLADWRANKSHNVLTDVCHDTETRLDSNK